MAERNEVVILHQDGREYKIPEKAFDDLDADGKGRSYKDLGFKITSYADGSAYPRRAARKDDEESPRAEEKKA